MVYKMAMRGEYPSFVGTGSAAVIIKKAFAFIYKGFFVFGNIP